MFVRNAENQRRLEVDDQHVSPASALSSRWLLHALEQTREYAHGRLLDVGCGAKPYRELFGASEHFGVDWFNSVHNIRVDAYASAEAIPFVDNSFDTVLSTEVIEHLKHPAHAVKEMGRVLKPGGHLILSAPFVHQLHEQPFDFFRFTPMGLQTLVEDAGMTPVALHWRGGRGTVILDLCSRMGVTGVRSVLRRFPFSVNTKDAIIRAVISRPQRVLASMTIPKNGDKSKTVGYPTKFPLLTLGCVIVARRLPT